MRDFASHVKRESALAFSVYLKPITSLYTETIGLRPDYSSLAGQIQVIASSPCLTYVSHDILSLPRSSSRAWSNTNPPPVLDRKSLADEFHSLQVDSKCTVAWECADLLIELGTGSASPEPPPLSQTSGGAGNASGPANR